MEYFDSQFNSKTTTEKDGIFKSIVPCLIEKSVKAVGLIFSGLSKLLWSLIFSEANLLTLFYNCKHLELGVLSYGYFILLAPLCNKPGI